MNTTDALTPLSGSGERRHVVILASAGTGKTHQLSNRYLKLLLDGESPERILATTFTRKAAGEIFDRIIKRLVDACFLDDERSKLATDLREPELGRDQCLAVLTRLSQQLHRVRVDTLDAFFAEVTRCFSLEMQLPGDWRIAEEAEDHRIRTLAVNRLLNEKELNASEQLVHWITGADSSRRVAKTLLDEIGLTYDKYAESRELGESAWKLIRPTPSKMAAELAAAIDHLQGIPAEGTMVKGVGTAVKHARARKWPDFLKTGLVKNSQESGVYHRRPIPQDVIDAVNSIRDHVQNEVCNRIARRTSAAYDLVREFDGLYWNVKRKLGAIRFDDVTNVLTDLSTANGQERLAYRLDGWIDHLLLDEFQDTSPMQWAVLKELAQRITSDPSGKRTFFCVGDIKQAIYGFRGGTSQILHQLGETDGRELPNLATETLNVSFRSDEAIIDFVNATFTQLDRHGNLNEAMQQRVDAWCREFPKHTTAIKGVGYACLESAPEPDRDDDGKPVESTRLCTLRYAAKIAAQSYRDTQHLVTAVLVDTNDAVATVIDELLRLGVNASAEGGNPLTDSAAVRIILSALEFAEHPADTAAAFHVAGSQLGAKIGLTDGVYDDRLKRADVAERIRRELLTRGYGDTISDWTQTLRPDCSRREWYRVQQFLDLAYSYSPNLTTRPIEFVHHVELIRKADPTASNVQVMTIHQCKGLGFDRVVVTDLARSDKMSTFCYQRDPITHRIAKVVSYVSRSERPLLPPAVVEVLDADDLRLAEDKLCDLYVSLTRAKRELRVVVPPSANKDEKVPKGKHGLLCAALTPHGQALPLETLFELGDRDWSKDEQRPNSRAEGHIATPNIQLRPVTDVTVVQPSGARDDSNVRRIALRKAFDPWRSRAMQFGTLIHTWLAHIRWLDDEPDLSDDRLTQLAASAELPLVDLQPAIKKFRTYLSNPEVQRILAKDPYVSLAATRHKTFRLASEDTNELPLFPSDSTQVTLEVRNELAIATTAQSSVWGTIDRLVLWKVNEQVVAAHVLDFKTDVVEGSLTELKREYQSQLDAYVAAVSDAFAVSGNQIQAELVVLSAGEIV